MPQPALDALFSESNLLGAPRLDPRRSHDDHCAVSSQAADQRDIAFPLGAVVTRRDGLFGGVMSGEDEAGSTTLDRPESQATKGRRNCQDGTGPGACGVRSDFRARLSLRQGTVRQGTGSPGKAGWQGTEESASGLTPKISRAAPAPDRQPVTAQTYEPCQTDAMGTPRWRRSLQRPARVDEVFCDRHDDDRHEKRGGDDANGPTMPP